MLATPPAPRLAPAAGTERALREVVRRARPFHERLHAARAAPVPPGDPSPAALKRLATWRETLSRGDDAAFNLRLAWDGLDEAAALAAMGDAPAEDGDAPLPAWAQVLRGAYAWDQGGVTLELAPDDRALDASDPLPFEPALLPLVRHARGQVERACGPASTLLHANAHAALERSLLKRLASLCAKALFARFSAARAMRGMGGMFAPAADGTAYDAFVASLGGGGMLRFFSDVPVAARLAGTATLQWIDTTAELLQRLGDDTPRLRDELFGGAAPGGVRRLRCDAADFHGGGRSVYILEFESGARAVYKPRPLALEPAFAGLAAWLAAQPEGVELRVPAVVALPTHGWLEFVERA
ncbi:MAG TPA: DUF4135 domain-containing protein, partial [Longimicrobium sp.]|nr:DUF4135 domain-containing protein [Longimicrobium sp.]